MVKEIKPTLNITYSGIYDRNIHKWQGVSFRRKTDIRQYKQKVITGWIPIERDVFNTIKKVSGLKWQKAIIDCYLVQNSISFSSPLTIRIMQNMNLQKMIIAHELVHNIITQNTKNIKLDEYLIKYADMHWKVKSHILHHAIFKFVLLKVFGNKNTKEYMEWNKRDPLYKKAWDIVELEGAENIIKKCIST